MSNSNNKKPSAAILLFRFITGQHLDGVHRTDSTFLRKGDRDLTPHLRASRWAFLPGWLRAVWRIGTLAVITATIYGWMFYPTLTMGVWGFTLICGFTYAGYSIYRRVRYWTHRNRKVIPLYKTLARLTEMSTRERPERYLSIPVNYASDEKARIRFTLPETFVGTDMQIREIDKLVRRRIGAGEWDLTPHHDASTPYLEWSHAPQPPAFVGFDDVHSAMVNAKMSEIILGIASHKRVISVDLDSESPHVALSMGTGGGKSATLRAIIAQLSRRGIAVDIIDPKMISQNWAVGLPGVRIHRSVESQMKCVAEFRSEMDSRYARIGESDEAFDFPRRVLIIEEYNSWITDLRAFWDEYRQSLSQQERSTTPRQNPAIGDVGYILNKGRQCMMNVIGVWQRMSANATGGADLRENFGMKILARYSHQTWKMLVGTTPVPRKSKIRGRAMVAFDEEPIAIQLAFVDKDEAREFAMSEFAGEMVRDVKADATRPDNPVMPEEEQRYTLAQAADNIVPMKRAALYKARERDPEFPRGKQIGKNLFVYTERELHNWQQNRVSASRQR